MANLGTKATGETSRPNFEPMQIMVVQFATDASGSFGANWWPNLLLMQVAPSGSVVPLAMFQLCSSSLSVGSFTIQLISKSDVLSGFVSDCQIS